VFHAPRLPRLTMATINRSPPMPHLCVRAPTVWCPVVWQLEILTDLSKEINSTLNPVIEQVDAALAELDDLDSTFLGDLTGDLPGYIDQVDDAMVRRPSLFRSLASVAKCSTGPLAAFPRRMPPPSPLPCTHAHTRISPHPTTTTPQLKPPFCRRGMGPRAALPRPMPPHPSHTSSHVRNALPLPDRVPSRAPSPPSTLPTCRASWPPLAPQCHPWTLAFCAWALCWVVCNVVVLRGPDTRHPPPPPAPPSLLPLLSRMAGTLSTLFPGPRLKTFERH
jgi:hypothetical protein